MEIAVLFILTSTIFLVAYVLYCTDLHDSKLGLRLPIEPIVEISSYSSFYPFYSPSPFSSPSFSFSPPTPISTPTPTKSYSVSSSSSSSFHQIGFLTLTKQTDKHPIILPLMGRRINRYKMQYYTISNSGFVNTELIIRKSEVDKKSFRNEYGVDELFTDDTVYVDGYKELFQVTLYDN